MEIIVDANGPEEQAMGWYYYLEDQLKFPFRAKCHAQRTTSPLRKGQEVEVAGMAPERCGLGLTRRRQMEILWPVARCLERYDS